MSSDLNFTPTEVGHYYSFRVPGVKQQLAGKWRGPCPLHNGKDDNFAVDPATGMWFCHSVCGRGGDIFTLEAELSGCRDFTAVKDAVLQIIGRVVSTTTGNGSHGGSAANVPEHAWVFLNQRIQRHCEQKKVSHVCNYHYRNADGRLCYIKARFVGADSTKKSFQKYAPTPRGGWTTPKRAGVQPMLYNLPLLPAADEIHFCNGEKAADAGRELGLVTTCIPDGEGHWDDRFTPIVKGKRVIVYLDNDAKGRKHGQVVARALFGETSAVRLVKLPNLPEKGDLYDWIEGGGTADELRKIIESTPLLETLPEVAPPERTPPTRRAANGELKSTVFRRTDTGILYIDPDPDKEPLIICGPLELAALTRDAKGDGWGRLLKWADAEGRVHEWAMPMSLLAGEGSEYRARLLDGGLFISPGRKARDLLTMYIQTTRVEARALCVSRIGWHGDNFVLPDTTIGPRKRKRFFSRRHMNRNMSSMWRARSESGKPTSAGSAPATLVCSLPCRLRSLGPCSLSPARSPAGCTSSEQVLPASLRCCWWAVQFWAAVDEPASSSRGGLPRMGWKPLPIFTTILRCFWTNCHRWTPVKLPKSRTFWPMGPVSHACRGALASAKS